MKNTISINIIASVVASAIASVGINKRGCAFNDSSPFYLSLILIYLLFHSPIS